MLTPTPEEQGFFADLLKDPMTALILADYWQDRGDTLRPALLRTPGLQFASRHDDTVRSIDAVCATHNAFIAHYPAIARAFGVINVSLIDVSPQSDLDGTVPMTRLFRGDIRNRQKQLPLSTINSQILYVLLNHSDFCRLYGIKSQEKDMIGYRGGHAVLRAILNVSWACQCLLADTIGQERPPSPFPTLDP